jgi:hypothetical protein
MLLCDHVAVSEGKLYINGAGWSQVPAATPFTGGLAVKLEVPWDQTNVPHEINLRLVDEDGHAITNDNDEPIGAQAKLEVGRPPGLRHGVALDAPLAVNFPGLVLKPGGYRWELLVDGVIEADVTFEAVGVK